MLILPTRQGMDEISFGPNLAKVEGQVAPGVQKGTKRAP